MSANPPKPKPARRAKPLTATQRAVLENLRAGRVVTHGARGRAEHGGYMSAYWALVRHGYASKDTPTDAGLEALGVRQA